ncbi:MAG: universal stress protein [Proteobacteria bacterium]|nr:universal stress protein [Pseudomonadota bacterium]
MKILLPVDGSDYTKRMLAYVAAHDELLGPAHDYVALHVVAPTPAFAARFLPPGSLEEHYRETAAQVLAPIASFAAQQGWKFNAAHLHGHAPDVIAAYANAERADLIVMGAHGYSAVGLLGSVTMGVLARCTVPLLLIR